MIKIIAFKQPKCSYITIQIVKLATLQRHIVKNCLTEKFNFFKFAGSCSFLRPKSGTWRRTPPGCRSLTSHSRTSSNLRTCVSSASARPSRRPTWAWTSHLFLRSHPIQESASSTWSRTSITWTFANLTTSHLFSSENFSTSFGMLWTKPHHSKYQLESTLILFRKLFILLKLFICFWKLFLETELCAIQVFIISSGEHNLMYIKQRLKNYTYTLTVLSHFDHATLQVCVTLTRVCWTLPISDPRMSFDVSSSCAVTLKT